MDEILASIRRIIENGDEREIGPLPPARGERAVQVERLGPDGDGANIVARLSPDPDAGGAPDSSAAEPAPAFSASEQEELAARLRDELQEDLDAMSGLGADLAAAPVAQGERDEAPEPQGLPPEAEAETAAPGAEPVGPFSAVDPERAAAAGTAPFVAANSDSRRMHDFRSAVLDDHASPAKEPAASAPLVSGRTGELVGASFDELAQAIRDGELRSLEDMAQELLRPMLQDWLDDNLPKLVERLVREEIERVARGGRR